MFYASFLNESKYAIFDTIVSRRTSRQLSTKLLGFNKSTRKNWSKQKKKITLKVEKFRNESWYFRFGAWLSKPSPIIDLASVYGQVGLSF